MNALVKAVRAHALAHYEQDGWDYVIECFSDLDIARELREAGVATEQDAIEVMHTLVKLFADRRNDVRSTIW